MKSWFSVQNKAESPAAEILIFDEIGLWGVTSKDFATALASIPKDREKIVGINSPGGEVFQGWAIYNLLSSLRETVTVRIDGIAASIASVIAMAGKKIIMPPASLLMIHNAKVGNYGESDELRQSAALLDKINGQIVAIYAQKTGKSEDEIRALMPANKDFWMTPAEAKDLGFIDEISGGSVAKAVATFDFRRFKNGPKPADGEPEVPLQTPKTMKLLMAALAAANFIPSVECSEEEAVSAFKKANTTLSDELANLQSQVDNTTKAAAEGFIAQAVKDGKIKDDAKLRERWVKAYIADASGTQEMVNAMEAPKRGGPPIPPLKDDPENKDKKEPEKKPELFGRERIAAAIRAQLEKSAK